MSNKQRINLISELKSIIFSDGDSIEVKVITEYNKSSFTYKAPKANVDIKKFEEICNIIQDRSGDTLFSDLTTLIIFHNEKYEREWLFAHRQDKSYEWNEIWTNMQVRDKISELLELTRVSVHLNNSKMSVAEKYKYLRDYYLSGWAIKNQEWIDSSILISERYKNFCCGRTYQPILLLEKYAEYFEEEMLNDFHRITFTSFSDEEEQLYYHLQLPSMIATSKSERMEEICVEAYQNKTINGFFEPGKFYMYNVLAKRANPKGVELLLKDLFCSKREDYKDIGYITQTENGRSMLDKVIVQELINLKKSPYQQSLLKTYLKLPKNNKVLKQIKKTKSNLNSDTLKLLNS